MAGDFGAFLSRAFGVRLYRCRGLAGDRARRLAGGRPAGPVALAVERLGWFGGGFGCPGHDHITTPDRRVFARARGNSVLQVRRMIAVLGRDDIGILRRLAAGLQPQDGRRDGVTGGPFGPAVHDADRLVSQNRRGAVAGLTGEGDRIGNVGPGTRQRVTAIMGARCGSGGRTGGRSGTGHDVRGARTAHSTHRQA